jgi:hypothetical protein
MTVLMPRRSWRPALLGMKPSVSMDARMRSAFSAETLSGWLR